MQKEAILDEEIQTLDYVNMKEYRPGKIFLTGATGFVGAFLLKEMLENGKEEIYCLVRDRDLDEAKNRCIDNMKSYSVWSDNYNKNSIIPVLGDISLPLLGLSESKFNSLADEIDVIYHNGALVNFVVPYNISKAPNVEGSKEILRLTVTNRLKHLHHVSTLGVFSDGLQKYNELSKSDKQKHNDTLGYTASKWVAGKLVMIAIERGIPCTIYRLGRISGSSKTGVCNPSDFFHRLMTGCISLGYYPTELKDVTVDLTPVDFVAKGLMHLSRQESISGQIFHLINPCWIKQSNLFSKLSKIGKSIKPVPYTEWIEKIQKFTKNNHDSPFQSIMFMLNGNSYVDKFTNIENLPIDSTITMNKLSSAGIICSEPDDKLLALYYQYFIERGLL